MNNNEFDRSVESQTFSNRPTVTKAYARCTKYGCSSAHAPHTQVYTNTHALSVTRIATQCTRYAMQRRFATRTRSLQTLPD